MSDELDPQGEPLADTGDAGSEQPDWTGEPVAEDVTVTDPPVPRQDEEVTLEEEAAPEEGTEGEAEPEAPTQDEPEQAVKASEKLDWSTAPDSFRTAHDKLKAEYLKLAESSVEARYLEDPTEFAKWMKEQSPTSYMEVGTLIATESAEANPKAWIEFFLEKEPDLLAQVATGIHEMDASGKPAMTMERLKAELDELYDPDYVESVIERNKERAPKAEAETPEQKRVREILERDDHQQLQAIQSEVFQPIETEIDALVASAGLEIKESDYKGKSFNELDDDTKFKVMVNEFIPMWINHRIQQDPKLVNMQKRLEEFIGKKDKTSAAALSHPAKIAATNFANEALSVLTGYKAKTIKSETESPTTDKPKPHVKSAANGNGAAPSLAGAPDWTVSDADIFGR